MLVGACVAIRMTHTKGVHKGDAERAPFTPENGQKASSAHRSARTGKQECAAVESS